MANEQQQQEPATSEVPDDGEQTFDEAFAAAAKSPGQTPEDEPADTDSSVPDPADEAGSTDAPDEGAEEEDTSEAKPAKAFDPWENLTAEQKAHFERLAASERSQRGRVSALTRKLNTMPSTGAPAPTEDKAKEPEPKQGEEEQGTAQTLDERLQAVMEDYGDVVGPIAEILKEVQSKVDGLSKAATTKDEVDADAEELTEAYKALETAHPDYQQYSAKNQDFTGWLGEQPEKVVELANSYDPREVSLVITMFKAERSIAQGTQPAESDEEPKGGNATDEKRKRQIEGSRQVSGRGQPAASGVPDDFEAAFSSHAKRIEKENA